MYVCVFVCVRSAQCHIDHFVSTQLIISWLIACPFSHLQEHVTPAFNRKLLQSSLLAIVSDNYEALSDNMRLFLQICLSISRSNILTWRKFRK